MLLLLMGVAYLGFRWACRRRIGYALPVWGGYMKSRDLAFFCSTIGWRLDAGAATAEALAGAEKMSPNRFFRKRVEMARARVEEGQGLARSLRQDEFFPRTLVWGLAAGESRGELSRALHLFAEIEEADQRLHHGAILTLVGPLVILTLGLAVLVTTLGVFSPMLVLTKRGGREPLLSPPDMVIVGFLAFSIITIAVLVLAYCGGVRRRRRMMVLVDHLEAITRMRLPIPEGLGMLAEDMGGRLGVALADAAILVRDGSSLTDALACMRPSVPPRVARAVSLGEDSGNAAAFLGELRESYRRLRGKPGRMGVSLIYPIVLTLVVGSAFFVGGHVAFPRIQEAAIRAQADTGAEGLGALRVLNGSLLALVGLMVAVMITGFAPRRDREMGGLIDGLGLALPPFRGFIKTRSAHEFARFTGLLHRAGATLPEAVGAVGGSEPNRILRERYAGMAASLREGERLSEVCQRERFLPRDLLWYVEGGEASGEMADHLLHAGDRYEVKLEYMRQALARCVGPAFVLVNGAFILCVWMVLATPLLSILRKLYSP